MRLITIDEAKHWMHAESRSKWHIGPPVEAVARPEYSVFVEHNGALGWWHPAPVMLGFWCHFVLPDGCGLHRAVRTINEGNAFFRSIMPKAHLMALIPQRFSFALALAKRTGFVERGRMENRGEPFIVMEESA